jgi:hypothetical protein
MLNALNDAYEILHLAGYYDGLSNVKVITEGFEKAQCFIQKLKQAI